MSTRRANSTFGFQSCDMWPFVMSPSIIPPNLVNIPPLRPTLLAFNKSQRWRRTPCWISDAVIPDHPLSRIGGPKKPWKFCANRMISFRDTPHFHFRRLGLKVPIPAHFWEVFREFDPLIVVRYRQGPKRLILGRKHAFWYIEHLDRSRNAAWAGA